MPKKQKKHIRWKHSGKNKTIIAETGKQPKQTISIFFTPT